MVDRLPTRFLYCEVLIRYGQVAQLVERGPEKAGVGGSTPSLGITQYILNALVPQKGIWAVLPLQESNRR